MPGLGYDIALIKTVEKIEYGEFVQPACLAHRSDRRLYEEGTKAIVSGWGSTDEKDTQSPKVLQAAELVIRNFDKCNKTYSGNRNVMKRSVATKRLFVTLYRSVGLSVGNHFAFLCFPAY